MTDASSNPCTGSDEEESENQPIEKFGIADVENIPFQDLILGPGEMLFMPRWHWHFSAAVNDDERREFYKFRQMEANASNSSQEDQAGYSFSVNFWWGPRKLKDF